LEDDLLGGLGGDASEVVGCVVPLLDDVSLVVELLAVDADLDSGSMVTTASSAEPGRRL
jgi:hypothetical protein